MSECNVMCDLFVGTASTSMCATHTSWTGNGEPLLLLSAVNIPPHPQIFMYVQVLMCVRVRQATDYNSIPATEMAWTSTRHLPQKWAEFPLPGSCLVIGLSFQHKLIHPGNYIYLAKSGNLSENYGQQKCTLTRVR